MTNTFKIIHKIKNSDGYIYYKHYIFIGNVPEDIYKVLVEIKDVSLQDALKNKSISKLVSYYGNSWYTFFYNKFHIKNSLKLGGNEPDENEELDTVFDVPEEQQIDNIQDTDDFDLEKVEIDEELKQTNAEIKKVIEKSKFNSSVNIEEISLSENEELSNSYIKIYIKKKIYEDDTIYKIKCKICDAITLDTFEDNRLLPSRLYFWSSNKNQKTILGYKWILKNQQMEIDIEPRNDINAYITLATKKLQDFSYMYKKYQGRIKREDQSQYVLYEYRNFIENNEIYMIDIYSQLNKNIKIDENKITNIINTFVRIYFPNSVYEFNDIINYLQDSTSLEKSTEIKRINNTQKTISNDLILEQEVMEIIENTKIDMKYFHTTYITQTIINSKIENVNLLNLRQLFDSFILDTSFPYIQLLQSYDKPIRKILKNKYFNSVSDTKNQAVCLRNWLSSIAYGLTIKVLAFESEVLSERYLTIIINESGRIQFKIQWKEENKTTVQDIQKTYVYLNKLIDKLNFENNLKLEYPTQFNYIFMNAIQKFTLPKINHNDLSNFARLFFPYVSLVIEPKQRTSQKKINNTGKWGTYLRYKRITNYENDTSIVKRIIFYLKNYEIDELKLVEIIEKEFNLTSKKAKETIQDTVSKYPIYKKKDKKLKKISTIPALKIPGIAIDIQGKSSDNYKIRVTGIRNEIQLNDIITFIQKLLFLYKETYLDNKKSNLLNKLDKLNDIATRRNIVRDIVNNDDTPQKITVRQMSNVDPERFLDTNIKYSRECQNTGKIIRRPQQHMNEKDLLEQGYKYNSTTKLYERLLKNGEKLIALKFETQNGNVYYTCGPEVNNERKYIGILSKVKGTLPCCFKKNQLNSTNKNIKSKLLEVLDNKDLIKDKNTLQNQFLYIKHYSSNKITNERLFFLPDLLDLFFNTINKKVIKNEAKLTHAPDGYYFLFGIDVIEYKFLHAISYIVKETVNQIKQKIINALKKDTTDLLFTSLNEGAIKNQFETRKNFINFIENSQQLDFVLIKDFILYLYQINVIIFEFNTDKTDFFINCSLKINNELPFAFLINDGDNYHIVIEIIKAEQKDNKVIQKMIYIDNKLINQVLDFYQQPCLMLINQIDISFYQKILKEKIKYQILDDNNKVILIVTESNKLLPVNYSGASYEIPILNKENIKEYITTYQKQIENISNFDFIKPKSLLLNIKRGKIESIKVNLKNSNLFIDYEAIVPIKEIDTKNTHGLLPVEEYYEIDVNNIEEFDMRKFQVNKTKIKNELLQLFRMELSNYLDENKNYKQKIEKADNIEDIKTIIEKICKKSNFIHVNDISAIEWVEKKKNDIVKFKLSNIRQLCSQVDNNLYCYRKKLSIIKKWLDDFIKIVSNQLINKTIEGKEILKEDNYYVSNIVNQMNFTNRDNQLILKGNEFDIQNIIDQLYGEGILPNLGKKKSKIIIEKEENIEFTDYPKYYSQKIIKNNNSIIRGLVNGLYYLLYSQKYPIDIINLGYFSKLQTNLVNYFKGKIVTYLRNYYFIYKKEFPKIFKITEFTIDNLIEIHKSFLINKYWLLTVWAFHKILNVSIEIIDINNKIVYEFKSSGKLIKLRISFTRNLPNEIEVLYQKEEKK